MKEEFLPINIRKAADADSLLICDMIFDIWINEYEFKVKREDYPDLRHIESYYQNKGGQFWVAVADDKIIGTIACDRLNEDQYILKRMFVQKTVRGQGIAQRLLGRVLSHLPPQSSIYLSTKEGEALAAKAFYLKSGFSIVAKDELPANFPFFYEDDLFMKKTLGTMP